MSLTRLAVEGLRAMFREWSVEQFEEAFANRMQLAPILPKKRVRMLQRLGIDAREKRLIEFRMDGASSLRDVIMRGGAGKLTAYHVLLLLTAFECLEFKAVEAPQGQSLADQLAARAARMARSNHFDALGVHWSAQSDDIYVAYQRLCAKAQAGSPWYRAAPNACEQIRAQADAAYEVLRDPQLRMNYRRATFSDMDSAALDDLLDKQTKALAMRAAACGLASVTIISRS